MIDDRTLLQGTLVIDNRTFISILKTFKVLLRMLSEE